MNLKQLLHHFTKELIEIYDEQEIISIFNISVEHISGFNRNQLMLKGDAVLEDVKLNEYLKTLARLKTGEPLQYIIGDTVFYGLTFKVNSSVLIPRPETEELVEWIIEKCKREQFNGSILDIGTGSGCIAISLKKNLNKFAVSAIDVSEGALAIANENALLNNAGVNFIHADILDFESAEKYDVIVSNPPYITMEEQKTMHINVLENEPHLALFVSNEKPLIFYQAIAEFALSNLKDNGLLFFEINEHLGKETVQMLSDKSFVNIELKKDIQGKDRMILASGMKLRYDSL
ncbi:protein-(glutamine-N5) methyltransferase, release factor-specific [Pedobacter ginsengisoli]|uniref:Release factor glutamine methyltransferase n=1 Tax=Pedobacter ginsengisoli TaxID=363852 RepID=A0A2D1U440_9SPHI|nr:peptide chain release factor N(5)-glutamine methyltransferase [Pedobacter ginsengisoli]ATP56380.1 protein-(glutamine-N5) methyltransferase, release factor-specific [Pedobacter ginsengisoli]